MNTPNKKHQITIEVNEEDACAIWGYQKFLERHIKAGDKIPSRVLLKFFSFFGNYENRIKGEITSQCETVKHQVIEKFSKDNEYNFSQDYLLVNQLPDLFNEGFPPQIGNCNLKDLIDYTFKGIISSFKEIERGKNEFLRCTFSLIELYFNSNFKGDTLEVFSLYKRRVLAGYITYKFGFHLSKEISKMNEDELTNAPIPMSTEIGVLFQKSCFGNTRRVCF